jgi:GH24 family phage-related lysozyme (muramidase)
MKQNKKYLIALGVAVAIYIIMDSKKTLGKVTYAQIQNRLFDVLVKSEGFAPKAVWDYAQWSIGHGEGWNWDKNRKVQPGDEIDRPTAKRWLIKSAEKYFNWANESIKVPVTENMMIALASLTYNIGPGSAAKGTGFKGSQLLKDLNAGKPKAEVAKGFDKYITGYDTKTKIRTVLPGLIRRRAEEKKLFLS